MANPKKTATGLLKELEMLDVPKVTIYFEGEGRISVAAEGTGNSREGRTLESALRRLIAAVTFYRKHQARMKRMRDAQRKKDELRRG